MVLPGKRNTINRMNIHKMVTGTLLAGELVHLVYNSALLVSVAHLFLILHSF